MPLLQKAYLGATPLFKEKSWFEDISQDPIDEAEGITITADNTAHTKGSWTELVASTSADATFIVVEVTNIATSTVDTATLLDIGVGASGSETELIPNIAVGGAANVGGGIARLAFQIPIKIASGTRLSSRIQSVVAGPPAKTATVSIWTFNMGDFAYAPTAVDVIGTSTATSAGTAMSGSSGTWVQITASTSNAYKAVVVVPSTSAASIGTIITKFTLGVGASGSEVEIGQTSASYVNNESVSNFSRWGQLICKAIPSGTRLSVRHDIAAGPGNYDVTLIGIR